MKIAKNKTISTLFALILMLTISATSIFVALPPANAHTPTWNVPTSAYISCAPGTIGLGQSTTIVVFVDRFSPTGTGIQGQRYTGYLINITKPDGKTVIIGPWTCASSVGSDFQVYTPDEVGNYTIVFSWPGNTIVAGPGGYTTGQGIAYIGDFFEGSTSKPYTLVVQQEPVPSWSESPVPTDYWTRPINGANREWATLPSNWLKGSWLVNSFQNEGTVPLTAHVLWSNPITPGRAGGLADAQWPEIPADVNDYESPWTSPIIMNGIIYYNAPPVADSNQYGYYAVNLHTGQQLWYKNGTDNGLNNPYTMIAPGFGSGGAATLESFLTLTQGQLYKYSSVNGEGVLSYLIMVSGSTWYFLDAATGNWMCSLINVPGGSAVTDENGDLLRYSYSSATGNILCWNSSQSIRPVNPTGTGQQQWRIPLGSVINAVNDTVWTVYGPNNSTAVGQTDWTVNDILPHSGYTMNVTNVALKGLPGSISVLQDAHRVPKMIFGALMTAPMADLTSSDYTTGTTLGSGDTFSVWTVSIDDHVTSYSPFPNATGTQNNNLGFGATLLLNKNNIQVPIPGQNLTWSISSPDYTSQTFQLVCKQLGESWCYSLATGALLWGPTASFAQMDYYGITENVYYGELIQVSSYGGWMAGYNISTGNRLWVYNAVATSPYESAYGNNMPLSLGAVVDGCALLYSTEHSPTKPLWRDSYVRCVNLTDGTEIWKLLDFNMGLSVADGYIVTGSQYDNNVYCIGKGPSKTTISAPQIGISMSSSFTITGTVTDQSPGAKDTAAIADVNQEAWMEYLYEQQVKPSNATGVPVTIDVIDPNGNFVNLGTTHSDSSGTYIFSVTPEMLSAGSGTYTVIASFAGSNSYGPSSSESGFTVNSEPAATTAPTPIPVSAADIYLLPGIVAIIIVIIIVGIALALLMLKKRP